MFHLLIWLCRFEILSLVDLAGARVVMLMVSGLNNKNPNSKLAHIKGMNWPEIWAHHVEQRLQSGSQWLGAGCRHGLFGFHGLGLCNVFKTVDLCANQFT